LAVALDAGAVACIAACAIDRAAKGKTHTATACFRRRIGFSSGRRLKVLRDVAKFVVRHRRRLDIQRSVFERFPIRSMQPG